MEDISLSGRMSSGEKPKVDLDWQSFPSTSAAAIPAGAAAASASSAPAQQAVVSNIAPVTESAGFNPVACLMPSFYIALFDVDTADVQARLQNAIWPLTQTPFFQIMNSKPDLYGPIWLCATLVFVIGASSNLASWLNFVPEAAVSIWRYDFRLVTLAMFTIYAYTLGGPILLWVVLSYMGIGAFLPTTLVTVYGYSAASLIPGSLFCIIPVAGLQWTAIVAAGLLSSLFIFKTLWPGIKEQAPMHQARALMASVLAVHMTFAVVLKLYFFSF